MAGLTRYGRRAEAARVASALLEAAPFFDFRLPEVFVGTDRGTAPVAYPTACSPHAWAVGTPLLLLRGLLGLRDVPGRWGRADAVKIR